MQKDFDQWNEKKKQIDAKENRLFFYQREIWWVNLGLNIGYEQNGKGIEYTRPVIIAGKEAAANLSQARNIDSKRLVRKIGKIERGMFNEIKKKASQMNFG